VGNYYYADHDGNVYKNTGSGWQKYDNGGWNSVQDERQTQSLQAQEQARQWGDQRSAASAWGSGNWGGGFREASAGESRFGEASAGESRFGGSFGDRGFSGGGWNRGGAGLGGFGGGGRSWGGSGFGGFRGGVVKEKEGGVEYRKLVVCSMWE